MRKENAWDINWSYGTMLGVWILFFYLSDKYGKEYQDIYAFIGAYSGAVFIINIWKDELKKVQEKNQLDKQVDKYFK